MALFAELMLTPGGVVSWIAVGLIAGWAAGVMMRGGGFGVSSDIGLGLVGALVGGCVAAFFIHGEALFWESILISFIGACMLIGVAHSFTIGTAHRY